MKTLKADLNLVVNTANAYDKTKTSIFGQTIAQKTLNGVSVIGPQLTQFIDVFTDMGAVPVDCYLSNNDNLYVCGAMTVGGTSLSLYQRNITTGKFTYQGRFLFTLPNTAATIHTLRSIKVDDSNTSNIKVYFATTGAVLINGGCFMINKVALSDFVVVGFKTVYQAISTDINGVYRMAHTGEMGAGNLMTVVTGMTYPDGDPTFGTNLFVHNGTAATHQFYKFDLTQTPTITPVANTAVNVNAGTTTFNQTAHGYVNGDQLVCTANNPTGLTLTTQTAVQTVYFVVNSAANTFQLSLTTGGAAILCSSVTTPTFCRAFGDTTSFASVKTGNLPALATLQNSNSEQYSIPSSGVLSGFPCVFVPGTAILYMGRLSELTSGATTWPSLISANLLGSGTDVVVPTSINACYSTECDSAFFTTVLAAPVIISKAIVNSVIKKAFGGTYNQYCEAQNLPAVQFKPASMTSLQSKKGLLFGVNGTTVGQRGIFVTDISSDDLFHSNSVGSYIVTKILATPSSTARQISIWEQLGSYTGGANFYYRTAATSADAIFNSATGSWTQITSQSDLSAITFNQFTQFKITFDVMNYQQICPVQVQELLLDYDDPTQLSDYWTGSVANSSLPGASPVKYAFRLATIYPSGTVPRLKVSLVDDAGGVRVYDTTTNAANFFYSTNNGTSWNALGTIPNTALTTEIYFQDPSPSGNPTTASIQEY